MEKDTTETVRVKDETETIVDSGILNLLRAEQLAKTRRGGFRGRAIRTLNTIFNDDYLIDKTLSVSSDMQKYVLKAKKRSDGTDCVLKALVMPSYYSQAEQDMRIDIFEAERDVTDALHNMLHRKGVPKVVGCGTKHLAKYNSPENNSQSSVLSQVIPFFITEFAKGGTVEDLGRSEDIRSKIRIFREIAETMTFVHENYNLAHRDIKPSNLMIGDEGTSRVIDWEHAVAMGQKKRDYETGSMFYLSPNHARGIIAIKKGREPPAHDSRSDVYPLGLSLGNTLFKGHIGNPVDVMRDYFENNVDDYCEFIASDPRLRFPSSRIPELDKTLSRMVSSENTRFKSMKNVAESLFEVECKL